MIRWPFQLAWSLVYPAGLAGGQQWRADQYVINAQAKVATEPRHAVIPPAETGFGLLEQTEGIMQAQTHQPLKLSLIHI